MVRLEDLRPELSRFFYTSVGGDWWWTDRLPWNDADWKGWMHRLNLLLAAFRGEGTSTRAPPPGNRSATLP
jgi:hypothetical protein